MLHTEMVTKYSAYFAKALSGSWAESSNNTIELDDVDPQLFQLFVDWVYSGRLELRETSDRESFLIHAWALGDRLIAPRFKDVVINALQYTWAKFDDEFPHSFDLAVLAYELSPAQSKLRQLVIDKFSSHTCSAVAPREGRPSSSELAFDRARAMSSLLTRLRRGEITADSLGGTFDDEDVCHYYHEHEDGEDECSLEDIRSSVCIAYVETCADSV